jgi:hypothetical protein
MNTVLLGTAEQVEVSINVSSLDVNTSVNKDAYLSIKEPISSYADLTCSNQSVNLVQNNKKDVVNDEHEKEKDILDVDTSQGMSIGEREYPLIRPESKLEPKSVPPITDTMCYQQVMSNKENSPVDVSKLADQGHSNMIQYKNLSVDMNMSYVAVGRTSIEKSINITAQESGSLIIQEPVKRLTQKGEKSRNVSGNNLIQQQCFKDKENMPPVLLHRRLPYIQEEPFTRQHSKSQQQNVTKQSNKTYCRFVISGIVICAAVSVIAAMYSMVLIAVAAEAVSMTLLAYYVWPRGNLEDVNPPLVQGEQRGK